MLVTEIKETVRRLEAAYKLSYDEYNYYKGSVVKLELRLYSLVFQYAFNLLSHYTDIVADDWPHLVRDEILLLTNSQFCAGLIELVLSELGRRYERNHGVSV